MTPEELIQEDKFATVLTTLSKHMKPINKEYSFSDELTYDFIQAKRDAYIANQKSTGLFGAKK
jgi:hypothetical protein